MSNNDYFSIAYKILSYLKYCYENGIDVDVDVLSPGTLNISNSQFYQTLSMLSDVGYIKGVRITSTTSGRIVTGISKLEITSSGLQYLKENSMMIKAYNVFKEVGNWLSLFKIVFKTGRPSFFMPFNHWR